MIPDDSVGQARAARDALRESEAFYLSLVETMPQHMFRKDVQSRFTFANQRFCSLLGKPLAEIVGRTDYDFYPSELADKYRADDQRVIQSGAVLDTVEEHQAPGDGAIFVHTIKTPIRDRDGSIIGTQCMFWDVTEQMRAELARQAHYHQVERVRGEQRAILDAASEAMVLISPESRIVTVNRRFEELFGIAMEQLVGRTPDEALLPLAQRVMDDPGRFLEWVAGAGDGRHQGTVRQRWPQERELDVSSTPVRSVDGEPLGRLYAFRDVTRERAVDRMKSEFVALVSHELRTPLTSIKGYVDLLQDGEVGELSEDQREFLGIVKSNADRQIDLIDELLDVSRLESGRLDLDRVELDLGPLVQSVTAALLPQIEAKGQQLLVELLDGLPRVTADPRRLAQALLNLLSNAHKFTPSGGTIRLRVQAEARQVRISVQDTGIGMSEEEQSQLFTRFFRAQNRTTEEVGGTGLGLAITRSLVQMHGGEISVQSAPGQGSTFSFSVPTGAHLTRPVS